MRELLELTRELADKELRPEVDSAERDGRFPRETFRLLGRSGLLGLPYPERWGGGGQPYEVYLQVVEELARVWLTVGLGVSVHTLTCLPVAAFGTGQQRAAWLPEMLSGELLGAYCLSEPQSGSDAAALATTALAVPGEGGAGAGYRIDGVKAWISHAGQADFYTVFARTSGSPDGRDRARGISCLHVPAGTSSGSPPRQPSTRWACAARPLPR